jgi:shikimate dehydrogenase
MAETETAPDRYALVGFPVAHSRSPMIHEFFARQTHQNLTYELIEADAEHFETAVRGFAAAGGKGMNVTVPHKERAYELCRVRGREARAAGAVNTISMESGTLVGNNTDGIGFMRDLTVNNDFAPQDKNVLVLGAGGAARGIIGPLLDADPAHVVIANRTEQRAAALCESLDAGNRIEVRRFDELEQLEPFDLVVNATSAGLRSERMPFPTSIAGPDSFCYDLVYSAKSTPFVEWATAAGARRAVQGWGMLVEQAAESFRIWRGIRPDTSPLIERRAA